MQFELLDRYSHLDSPIHRLGAVTKMVLSAGLILIAVLTPFPYWPVFVTEMTLLLAVYWMSGLPWTYLFKRLSMFLPMVVLMAVGVPLSRGLEQGWQLMGKTLCGATLSFVTVLLLVATTPVVELLAAMRRLRVPALPVTIGSLMIRYVVVLLDEMARMRRAKAARTFESSRRRDWAILPNLVGSLFLRSIERSERVYQAMLARGWSGEIHTLHDGPASRRPQQQ